MGGVDPVFQQADSAVRLAVSHTPQWRHVNEYTPKSEVKKKSARFPETTSERAEVCVSVACTRDAEIDHLLSECHIQPMTFTLTRVAAKIVSNDNRSFSNFDQPLA